MAVTGLNHINNSQFDTQVFNNISSSIGIGPLRIDYSIDLSKPEISATVFLCGISIGGGTINPSNPKITIGGGVAGFKAEVTLEANFAKQEIDYTAEVCAPIIGCTGFNGKLFSW